MNRIIFSITTILCCMFSSSYCAEINKDFPESFSVSIKNSIDIARTDVSIILDIKKIKQKYPEFNPKAFIVVDGTIEIASQTNDINADNADEEIVFVMDLPAKQTKNITIRYAKAGEVTHAYKKRTQAEISCKSGGTFIENKSKPGKYEYIGGEFHNLSYIRVPHEHTDHSWYIRYEGPGWESDKVGYRFYLDWRNAYDIFGKLVDTMVLQGVGLDGFDSYHEIQPWGADIFKVGNALGLGAPGIWANNKVERFSKTDSTTCQIILNGPVQSMVQTKYYGMNVDGNKYDITSNISIKAGSRMSKQELLCSATQNPICTGIIKDTKAEYFASDKADSPWAYIASYGKQSLMNDSLGLAIIYKKVDVIAITEDQLNHVVQLKPDNSKVTYYFLAAWEKELKGITNKKDFIKYLNQTITELSKDPIVTY